MAKAKSSAKKQNVNNTINIKSLPVQCHIGASKFVNDDWGTMAFSIPRNQIQNKFADPELRYNFIYFLFGYENSKEVVYVGQAKKRNNGESVLKRLREHDTSADNYERKAKEARQRAIDKQKVAAMRVLQSCGLSNNHSKESKADKPDEDSG